MMVKTLNNIVSDVTENHLATTVKDTANQIWLAGLGAFAKAQDGGSKMFDALVKDGEAFQSRTKKAAADKITGMTSKTTGSLDKLEQVFQERVARALKVLGVPTSQDIAALSDRVVQLTEAVARLSGDDVAAPVENGAEPDAPEARATPAEERHAGKQAKAARVTKAEIAAEHV